MHFFPSFPRFYISFISSALPVAALGTSGKRVTGFIIFFVSALVLFLLLFFFLSGGKGEPARSSNATATSCCSLPIQPSSVQHPPFESSRIKHKALSFCLLSLTPGWQLLSTNTTSALQFSLHTIWSAQPSPPALLAAFNEQFHTLHGRCVVSYTF